MNYIIWLAFPVIFITSFFLYYPSLDYYFFQDDWFVLNWVRSFDLLDFIKFRSDIIYWRPLSMPIFFKFSNLIFGLNPFGFHLFALGFHFINSALIYFLFRELKFKKEIAYLIAFLYATASFHLIPLSWLSTTSYIIGPSFIFSSLIFFLKNKVLISFALFLLGLTSSELTLTMIPIALILKSQTKLSLGNIIPFAVVAAIYLALRFVFIPLPQEGQYNLTFTPKIFTNIFWYFVWAFNVPEAISTVFYFSRFKESQAAILQFWQYIITPLVVAIYTLIIIRAKTELKKTLIGISIFLFGLSPIIFLPFHIYPMYLIVATIGIFYILASSLARLKSKLNLAIYSLSLLWFISSFLTLKFTRTNHWLVNLQSISKAYTQETQNLTKKPPDNSVFIFKFADIEYAKKNNFVLIKNEQNIRQALNDQDAIQVIFKDKSLKSLYETEQQIPVYDQNKPHFIVEPQAVK